MFTHFKSDIYDIYLDTYVLDIPYVYMFAHKYSGNSFLSFVAMRAFLMTNLFVNIFV